MAKKTSTTKNSTKSTSKKKANISAEFDLLDDRFVTSEEKTFIEEQKNAEEEAIKNEFKKKSIGPYQIMKMMLEERHSFDALTDSVLKDNYFLINRQLAALFPQQAAKLSLIKINEAQVIRFWANFLKVKGYTRIPYIKTEKQSIANVNIDELDEEMLANYMKRYNLSKRDLNDMLIFFNQQTIEEIKRYISMYSPEEQIKLFTKEKSSKKKFESEN